MNEEAREWGLYVLCAVLLTAVLVSAWLRVPELQPVEVMPVGEIRATDPSAPVRETPTDPPDEGDRIRLNSATVDELTQIPGLGEKTAQRIVAYRDAHGGFRSLEELLVVEGVGSKKLEQWRPYLTL